MSLYTYKCPVCGNTDSIDVTILTSARLYQSEGNFETEVDGDHEFAGSMFCRECDFSGPEDWFQTESQNPEELVVERIGGGTYKLRPEGMHIEGYVLVEHSEVVDNNFDGFLDIASEKLVGHDCLMEVNPVLIGVESGMLQYKVTGVLDNEYWHEFLEDHVQTKHLTVCAICGEKIVAKTAHQHNGGYVGTECCWVERLRATE
ncbi:hypothetical protein FY034_17400 (plasmid) [Trichlorobacter lovleyi]|uniref:hypothetical protein n=1 Tax=Trichlorobacter lovleyi TaxID=313985 RepID=UPI002240D1AB|nr:hypothetical protein [Trichlorobacter lovleyi]QOX80800.1 hypothetical protein FY034_17400 [Trichlorobacter lovleyi]